MKILDYTAVLPAFFKFEHNNNEYNIFGYIDHKNKMFIIASDLPEDIDSIEFSNLAYNHILSKNTIFKTPNVPKEGFDKLKK